MVMALYGIKQAGRAWYLLFDKFLKALGFSANKADHCFYTKNINDFDFVLLLLYVDDIIIAATTEGLVLQYRELIGKRFRMSHSGVLRSYLNIDIEHDRSQATIYLGQQRFIEEMIREFCIPVDTSVVTPMQENLKLLATEEEMLNPRQLQYVKKFPYRKLVGVIIYLNVCTRPTVSYAISILAQFKIGRAHV